MGSYWPQRSWDRWGHNVSVQVRTTFGTSIFLIPFCVIFRHYVILYSLITIGLPTIIPSIFWKESLWIAFSMNLFRFAFNFSYVGLANSISHSVGTRPYDGNLSATENNFMFYWTFGEGYHNYHHAFPLDYRSPHSQGILTTIIEICAKFGWIYDLKLSSPEIVASRMKRTGDGSIEIPSKQL